MAWPQWKQIRHRMTTDPRFRSAHDAVPLKSLCHFDPLFIAFEARAIDDFFLCISPSVLIFGDLLWFSIAIGDSNVLLFSLFDANDASTKLLFLRDKVIYINLIKKCHTIAYSHRNSWMRTNENRFQILMMLVLVAGCCCCNTLSRWNKNRANLRRLSQLIRK